MEQYNVTGMSCAACSTRVEKAVSKVPGVTSCSVSLLTNSMGVEGTASPHDIINAVEQAGYGASLKGAKKEQVSISEAEEALEDHETPILKRRLIARKRGNDEIYRPAAQVQAVDQLQRAKAVEMRQDGVCDHNIRCGFGRSTYQFVPV